MASQSRIGGQNSMSRLGTVQMLDSLCVCMYVCMFNVDIVCLAP